MLRLAGMLYLLIAPVLAGTAVLVGLAMPELGFLTLDGVGKLAGAGFAAGVPLSLGLAAYMNRRASRPA